MAGRRGIAEYSRLSAEGAKETASQGSFGSEGSPEGHQPWSGSLSDLSHMALWRVDSGLENLSKCRSGQLLVIREHWEIVMAEFAHHLATVNGIKLHYVSNQVSDQLEQQTTRSSPLVVFCHGFPGLWYSWRHQLLALANAGYRAIAIDQRGYGQSDRPLDASVYDSNYLVRDMLGLLDHLGEEQAILVGHDFGAAWVYNVAARHPDRVAAVVGSACPYDFDLAGRGCTGSNPPPDATYLRAFARPDKRPTECFAEVAARHFYHMHYYQTVGPAEAELGARPREFLERLFWALSADGHLLDWTRFPSEGNGYLDVLAEPDDNLPWKWMSNEDMDYYVEQFCACESGAEFIGGINSYRVADKNWEIGLEYIDHNITPPSLFIAGEKDPVLQMIGEDAMNAFKARSPNLKGIHIIPNAGHFVQMEQAEAFNAVMLDFLSGLTP